MPLTCGSAVGLPTDPGRIGCLVSYADAPTVVYLLSAMHVLVGSTAQRGDPVYSPDLPSGAPIGRLRSWTSFAGPTTVDAALVWIDPSAVSPQLAGIAGAPSGVNLTPQVNDKVFLPPAKAGDPPRQAAITQTAGGSADLIVSATGWSCDQTYVGQIICTPMFSQPGDSGSMVVDAQNRIVGMVVGAVASATVVTPIQAILEHPDLNGGQTVAPGGGLVLVTGIPGGAVGPTPPLPPAPASSATASAPAPAAPAVASVAGSDGAKIAGLIALASDATKLDSCQRTAARKLLSFDGEIYPSDGCAITLSVLLQQSGIAVPDTFEAIALGDYLRARRGWQVIDVGDQRAGDVGSTCGDEPHHGTDHIYLVLKPLNTDEMLIADNQSASPHFRYASGAGGKTPTKFFLRAPS